MYFATTSAHRDLDLEKSYVKVSGPDDDRDIAVSLDVATGGGWTTHVAYLSLSVSEARWLAARLSAALVERDEVPDPDDNTYGSGA